MQKRRTVRVLFAAILVVSAGVVAGAAMTGRLPLLAQAWETIASSVGASLSPPPPSSLPATDARAPREDGGSAALAAARSKLDGASAALEAARSKADAGPAAHRQTAPLSSAQLGAPLVHGTFVSACGAPDDMKVVVDVAVKMGRAVSVAVRTQPPSPEVSSCVERAIRSLQWDVSPKTDHLTVTY